LNKEQPLEMVPTFLGAHEVPDNYRDNRPAYIQLVIEEMIPEVSRRKLAKYCDVFCETGVFSVEESRQILLAGKRNGLQIRMHADELSSSGGAELAADLAAVTADHLIKVSDEGIRAMAEKQVIPVLLPATTFFLRKNAYAPADKMRAAGCRMAIATDFNPGSSMTQNMQLVWTISALKLGMLPGELLWASTLIPALSLNLGQQVGSIEIGKQGDLLLLDIPNLEYLAYHMGINHVAVTLKKGEVVFRKC
ncbi:MAG: imidazolonepropionase, partial [Calditrichales bacterium]